MSIRVILKECLKAIIVEIKSKSKLVSSWDVDENIFGKTSRDGVSDV